MTETLVTEETAEVDLEVTADMRESTEAMMIEATVVGIATVTTEEGIKIETITMITRSKTIKEEVDHTKEVIDQDRAFCNKKVHSTDLMIL